MKKQVVVIHGGDTKVSAREFTSYLEKYEVDKDDFKKSTGWKTTLDRRLGRGYEVFNPRMPNDLSASYKEWKVWFEKLLPFLEGDVIFVGHSLGGIFLVKYISENTLPVKARAVLLVAPPFAQRGKGKNLGMADFILRKDLSLFERQAREIFLYQSKDDPLVPFRDMEKYKHEFPKAKTRVFTNRKHLWQKEFPEIIRDIKSL